MGVPTGVTSKGSLQSSQVQGSGPTDETMSLEMRKLGELLASLEVVIAHFTQRNEEDHSKATDGYVALAQTAYKNAVQAYNTYEQESQAQGSESFWQTFGEALLTAVCAVGAILTGQVELVVVMVAFTVLQASGGMKDVKKGLSQSLEALGCSPKAASLLADAIIVGVTILVSHSAGSGLGSLCESAGFTLTRTVAETVSTTTEEVAEETAATTVAETAATTVAE